MGFTLGCAEVRRGVNGVKRSCKCVIVPVGALMAVEKKDCELSSTRTELSC